VSPLLTVPRLEQIPWLRHGFGDATWAESRFRESKEWASFKPLFLNQVHSGIVHFIDGVPAKSLRGDAMVTSLPGLLLVIKSADCLPVLLVDVGRRVIAAVHCGWKGTLRRILERPVTGMRDHYGSDPEEILAAFGPGIGAGCYEVGEVVRRSYLKEKFPDSIFRPVPARHGKYFFDLAEANRLQLVSQGIKEENIFKVGVCTHCDERYPSYRRDGKRTGRMLSFIGISPP
jgi:YfiH family protein